MRAYEVMIIIDVDVDDAGVRQQIAKATEIVEAEGGKVATTDLWGRRRFAATARPAAACGSERSTR